MDEKEKKAMKRFYIAMVIWGIVKADWSSSWTLLRSIVILAAIGAILQIVMIVDGKREYKWEERKIVEPKQEKKETKKGEDLPSAEKLLYPERLPRFEEIERAGHEDVRAAVYTMLRLDAERRTPFRNGDLNAGDFGGGAKARKVLLEKGLIRKLEKAEAMEEVFTKEELKEFAKKAGVRTTGTKKELAERLKEKGADTGRKGMSTLFRITEKGKAAVEEYKRDHRKAVDDAIEALKGKDYEGAINAYREFDRKWGFEHSSGKRHTIFAHYDIPIERFRFLAWYGMGETRNTENFKNTLRSCMTAGLMRGCQEKEEIAEDFTRMCEEKINCNVVRLYRFGFFEDEEDKEEILRRMQKNIEEDDRCALEYYISRAMYLSRKACEIGAAGR